MKNILRVLFAVLSFSQVLSQVFIEEAFALKMNLGPYMQKITPNSAVIKWYTDDKSDSVVEFGKSADNLDQKVTDNKKTKDHEIVLKGLEPFTRYYYSVSSDKIRLAGGPEFRFVTAPSTDDQDDTVRVWMLGDPGTGKKEQSKVAKGYLQYMGNEETDVILTDGDNAYSKGRDSQFREKFFPAYKKIFPQVAVWPAKGNHDSDVDVYQQFFSLPSEGEAGGVPSKSELYYSFNYGFVHFISVNSDIDDIQGNDPMLKWLKEDLAANTKQWTIAYFHHAPYSRGSHDSDDDEKMTDMRKYVLPLLENGGVDLVLGGHSHNYERSMMLRGHYRSAKTFNKKTMVVDASKGDPQPYVKKGQGPIPNSGAVFQLIGTSGRKGGEGDLNHPTTLVGSHETGSVVLTITKNRLESVFLTIDKKVKDRFAIVKQ